MEIKFIELLDKESNEIESIDQEIKEIDDYLKILKQVDSIVFSIPSTKIPIDCRLYDISIFPQYELKKVFLVRKDD